MALDSEAQTSWKDHTIYVKKNYPVVRSDATRCDAMRCEAMRSAGLEDSLKGQDWRPSSYKVLHVVLCLKGLRYPVVSQGIRSQQPVAKNEICHHKPPPSDPVCTSQRSRQSAVQIHANPVCPACFCPTEAKLV